MAYYYMTSTKDIYKKVGARKVRRIYTGGIIAKIIEAANKIAQAELDLRLPKIVIPMMRQSFPQLIASDIVGVQPMSGPVGLSFALRYKYNSVSGMGDFWTFPAGFRRSKKYRQNYKGRNTMSLSKFKQNHTIKCETSNWYDIVFELSMENLK